MDMWCDGWQTTETGIIIGTVSPTWICVMFVGSSLWLSGTIIASAAIQLQASVLVMWQRVQVETQGLLM
jgi:hypothetical protein